LTSIDGVAFGAAYSRRETGEFGGVPASFIARRDPIDNHRASGRPKDLADLRRLEADE